MDNYFFYSICLFYILITILNIIRTVIVKHWVKNKLANSSNRILATNNLYLIIPLYNEQNIVKDTYDCFTKLIEPFDNVYLVFVTTEKETIIPSTKQLIMEKIKEKPVERFIHLHYPLKNGVMAHQLNFAFEYLQSIDHSDFWVGIYNADSRINNNTLSYVLSEIPFSHNCCFQQYSWYRNPKRKKKSLVGSASLWQLRWSICFELYRTLYQSFLKRYFSSLSNSIIFERMNYVIGHGLFISKQNLKELEGFPENSINEDAFLGLKINCAEVNILPIPYLEEADFASNTSIYLKQQTVWFNGPLYSFSYYKSIANSQKKISIEQKIRYLSLSIKLFLHAVYWVLGPILLLCVLPFFIHDIFQFIFWILVVFLELPFTHYIVKRAAIDLGIEKEKLANPSLIYCSIFYLFHCLGPLRGIVLKLVGRNTQKDKYKTER